MEPPEPYLDSDAVRWNLLDCTGDIPTSEGLHGHSTVLYDDNLFIYGGASHGYATNDFFIFDLAQRRWHAVKPDGVDLPVSADHFAIKVGHSMLIYGGRGHAQRRRGIDSNIPQPIYNHIYQYFLDGPRKGTVRQVQQTGSGPRRKAFSLVLHNQELWLFGGWDHQRIFNEMWKLDVSQILANPEADDIVLSWKHVVQKGEIPEKRHGHTAHIWKDKMLVYGGTSGFSLETGYVHHNKVILFDFATKTWSSLDTTGANSVVVPGTESHSSILIGDDLLVWGGRDASRFQEDVYRLNLNTLQWSKLGELGARPPPRCCMCAELLPASSGGKHTIVVVGGYGPRYYWGAEDETEFEEVRDMFGRVQLKPIVEPFLRYKDVYLIDYPIRETNKSS